MQIKLALIKKLREGPNNEHLVKRLEQKHTNLTTSLKRVCATKSTTLNPMVRHKSQANVLDCVLWNSHVLMHLGKNMEHDAHVLDLQVLGRVSEVSYSILKKLANHT